MPGRFCQAAVPSDHKSTRTPITRFHKVSDITKSLVMFRVEPSRGLQKEMHDQTKWALPQKAERQIA